jgi:hypothetical protein
MENSGGSGPTLSNGGGQCGRRRRAPGGRRLRRRNWRRAAIRSLGGIARPAVIVWDTDANGDYVSEPIGSVSSSSLTAEVLQVPGTTPLSVTPIETDGATTLAELPTNTSRRAAMGSDRGLIIRTAPSRPACSGPGPRSARLSSRRAGIRSPGRMRRPACMRFGMPTLTAITSATPIGAAAGTSLGLEVLDWSFDQDLNRDGAIGPLPPSSCPSRPTARPP